MTVQIAVDTLDRSRPYATVHGEETNGKAFSQRAIGIESWPYDHDGKLIEELLTSQQKAKREQKIKEAIERAVEARNAPPEPDVADDEGEDKVERLKPQEDPNEEVNLVQWLKGDVRYKPFEVQSAIKARFGANKPNMKEAARYLVEEQKLVSWSEVASMFRPPKLSDEG